MAVELAPLAPISPSLPSRGPPTSGGTALRWILLSAVAALALYAFHRFASYAAARGWVYYRNGPKRGYSLGFIEEVFQPSMEYVFEEESSEAIRADWAESGQGDVGLGDDDGTR